MGDTRDFTAAFWVAWVCMFVAVCASVAFSFMAVQESRKTGVEPVVVHVIQVDNPELATAIMLLGEDRMERQALIDLAENYATLLGMYSDRLVEEMRK